MLFNHVRTGICRRPAGFTLVEILVVMALIGVLVAILLPALFAASGQGARTLSQKNLNNIGQWMAIYQSEFRGTIVPSRFDYTGSSVPGKAKSENVAAEQFRGTWTDILWTRNMNASFPDATAWSAGGHDYEFDSPDAEFYSHYSTFDGNPFRSAVANQRGPQKGLPGYFAANNFFDADAVQNSNARWWTIAQIKNPARSLYCIDSWVGETIDPVDNIWGRDATNSNQIPEVDYRYQGDALVLLLDGSVTGLGEVILDQGSPPTDLDVIENDRDIKVRNLNSRY